MKKFEHKIIRINGKGITSMKYDYVEMESMLTGFGLKGWELIDTHHIAHPSGKHHFLLFLKREIENA